MKTSEIVMLAGVGLLGYALFKNSASAQTPLTPQQQAQLQYQMQTQQGRRVQAYVSDGISLLHEITGGLTNGFSPSNNLYGANIAPGETILNYSQSNAPSITGGSY